MLTLFRKALAAAALALPALTASAGTYPEHAITLMIPYPPAGTADAIARPLSVVLSKRLGVPVVLEYKGGAGGAIATQYVSHSNADGYTLLMVLAAHAINPSLYKNLPYDSVKDFTPVSMVARLPLVLYSNPKSGLKTVADILEEAKKNPGKLSFGSAGSGNTSHLAGELFASSAGVQLLHVPYKGGGPSVTATIGGEIPMVFAGPDSLGLARSGRLHTVAVTSLERSALAPDVPTIAETLKGFEVYGWYGILAPAKTPDPIVAKLNAEINASLQDPEFKKLVEPLGYIPTGSTPAEFGTYIQNGMKRWQDVITKANIHLE